ncbi:hypothetical protein [Tomitella gaofuii]|uniref:hypothetical protein n=1 Tax=Tomitella gaofuii TaxID=2760083 RepID=UPI0015FA483C|nr:hypothetical protein [Tomitella gaofuii]
MNDGAGTDLRAGFQPEQMSERGRHLWDALAPGFKVDAGRLVLLAEACRLVASLDQLDRLISGEVSAWAQIDAPDGDGEYVLRIDGALSERRSVMGVLRLTIRQLETEETTSEGGGLLDALAAARAERLATAPVS